jgi:hypothetical protein
MCLTDIDERKKVIKSVDVICFTDVIVDVSVKLLESISNF